jgi:DNA-directed RNA polymerase specialized sigma24 family protein
MPILHSMRGRRTNEELFFDHYSQLLGWASQLVHSDRADAEDLVQEFYIHVTRSNVALANVEEIQPYLFKVLRNLHYSRLRQEGRSPIYDLSIVDYDSVEWGLAAVDRRGLFLARDNLKIICEFVCQRKNTSRASSIFILRFFMGYFPSEVMKVAQLTRVGVDKSIQFVRRETQLHLNRPEGPRSVVSQDRSDVLSSKAVDDSHALFLELHRTIFSSCMGTCFSPSALEKRYRGGPSVRFTTLELAHIVSCKNCLNRANSILGLPLLEERSPDDTIGRDNSSGSGGVDAPRLSLSSGTKRTAGPKERRALDRKARGVLEHRPESLEISVNGDTRTSQRITAEVSEFHLKLSRTEAPEFIEIFSEQRIRLMYLHVMEPTSHPGLEQHQRIDLSDGRSLDLTLSFANDLPIIHVVYRDPVMREVAVEQSGIHHVAEIAIAGKTISTSAEPVYLQNSTLRDGIASWDFLRTWFSKLPGNLHIFGMLAAFACLLLAVFSWPHPEQRQLPKDILQVVIQHERALPVNAAEHAVFSYQEDDVAGHLQQADEIDMWRQSAPQVVALRFYNAHHIRVGGFVRNMRGAVEYGYKGDNAKQNRKPNFAPGWHDVPSAESFVSLLSPGVEPEIVQSDEQYRIMVRSPRARPDLTVAVLVVDRRSLRAVEADYDLRDGEGVHHVRLREVSYEVRSAGEDDRGVFDVGADFDRPSHRFQSAPGDISESIPNTMALELQVFADLMRAGAGEQIEVHRDRQTGMVEIQGVVDTPEKKKVVLNALASLTGDSHLKVLLRSADELLQTSVTKSSQRKRNSVSASSSLPVVVGTFQAASFTVPADAAIRTYLESSGLVGRQLDAAIRSFANQACSLSLQTQQSAYRLAQLSAEFTPADLARLDTASRLRWLMVVANYSEEVDSDLKSLQSHLKPVLGNVTPSSAVAVQKPLAPLTSPDELAAASRNLLSQTTRLNEQVQFAFSVTAVSSGTQLNPSPMGDAAFAEIARLIESSESRAANTSTTAQQLKFFATSSR